MSKEFLWIKPRDLSTVLAAIKDADSITEREQYKRFMYRGLLEWAFILTFCLALVAGFFVIPNQTKIVLARLYEYSQFLSLM